MGKLITIQKGNQVEKLGIVALQKQLDLLKAREVIAIVSFISIGVIGRAFIHGFSVEPIIFLAVLAGWLFGWKKGAMVGASALFISNFIVGGQGPWTVFQMIGFGFAGFMGGFLRKNASIFECSLIVLISTVVYEIVMNISSIIYMPNNIFGVFLLSLPFTLTHIVSNLIFSTVLPKVKRFVEQKGQFNSIEICKQMIMELKCKIKS